MPRLCALGRNFAITDLSDLSPLRSTCCARVLTLYEFFFYMKCKFGLFSKKRILFLKYLIINSNWHMFNVEMSLCIRMTGHGKCRAF